MKRLVAYVELFALPRAAVAGPALRRFASLDPSTKRGCSVLGPILAKAGADCGEETSYILSQGVMDELAARRICSKTAA